MKVSIVTISYNQGRFLEKAILSVLEQDYPDIEYIVVDAGSTDGSRDIIEKYREQISRIIFEPDQGAADGLNKGFRSSSGLILGYLNSDDVLLPGTVKQVVDFFNVNLDIDVVSGHCYFIGPDGEVLRKGYSDNFNLRMVAYNSCVLVQPSTFFTRQIYMKTAGFNILNKSNWDGELIVDMALQGARFKLINKFWSEYRLHPQSTTGSNKTSALIIEHRDRMFKKIIHRDSTLSDIFFFSICRVFKHIRNPKATVERIFHGPVYGRYV